MPRFTVTWTYASSRSASTRLRYFQDRGDPVPPLKGKKIHQLKGHIDNIRSVAISADGKMLLTGSRDKTAKLWDAVSGQLIHTIELKGNECVKQIFSSTSRMGICLRNDIILFF